MYSWGATTLIIELADGARAEADPAVFTLFTLATAAGRMGAPVVLSEELRARGARCRTEMARYRSLARRDDRGLHGLLAQTVLLGPPPTFARDRDPDLLAEAIDGQFVELSSVLSSFWRCADLQPLWEEHRPEWIDAGQRELAAATRPLQEARSLDPERWPDVRIVPSLLDNPGTVSAVSWGNEVSVFVGPHGRQSDPGVLVQEALQHAVTGVLSEQSCPAVDEAHAAVASRPAVQDGVDRWLAANIARALTIQSGVLPGGAAPEEAVQGWTDEGFTLVPGVLAGLKRMPWDVWVTDLCGWDTPADDL